MGGREKSNLELCRVLSRFYEKVHSLPMNQYSDYLYGLSKVLGVQKKRIYNYYYNLGKMEKELRAKSLNLHYFGFPRAKFIRILAESEGFYCLCHLHHYKYRDGVCYFCHIAGLKFRAEEEKEKKQEAMQRTMERKKDRRILRQRQERQRRLLGLDEKGE